MPASSDRWSGDSTCGFCLQLYVVELERHCGCCDRPLCPLCPTVVGERGSVLCPECAAGDAFDEES